MRVATRPDNPLELAALAVGQVPRPLFEGYFGLMAARTLMAGTSLGIFDALQERPDDAAGLAQRLELDEQGVDALLVGLHSMNFLRFRDGAYSNSRQAERHLVKGAAEPLRETLASFSYDMWNFMGQVEEVVRSGEPVGLHEGDPDDPWWRSYMNGLFELANLRAPQVVKMIPADDPERLIDIAGGHGAYSLALCRRHPRLRATILELEGAARIGREIVAGEDGGDRVTFEVGDMFESDLGTGYDIAMANSILHHFDGPTNIKLLGRAHEALVPGGTMAVVEQERPPEGKRGQQIGGLTGVLFYVTSKARTYSGAELEGFLREAGFSEVKARRSPLVPGVVVTTGKKEG